MLPSSAITSPCFWSPDRHTPKQSQPTNTYLRHARPHRQGTHKATPAHTHGHTEPHPQSPTAIHRARATQGHTHRAPPTDTEPDQRTQSHTVASQLGRAAGGAVWRPPACQGPRDRDGGCWQRRGRGIDSPESCAAKPEPIPRTCKCHAALRLHSPILVGKASCTHNPRAEEWPNKEHLATAASKKKAPCVLPCHVGSDRKQSDANWIRFRIRAA